MKNNTYQLFDEIHSACVVIDSQLNIIYFNHFFTTLFDLGPARIKKAKNILSLFNKNEILATVINDALTSQHIQHSNETALNHISHVAIKAIPDRQNIILNFDDFSEQRLLLKKYQQRYFELKELHGQLIQADKTSIIGEMTAGISHEISNPLTIASGSLEVIRIFATEDSDTDLAKKIAPLILDIGDSFERVNNIVKNMKNFISHQETIKEYCRISEIIDKSIDLVQRAAEKRNISIKVNNHSGPKAVLANAVNLEQVFINIIKNAIDAMADRDGLIRIDIANRESFIEISFIDQGGGISDEHLGQIFNPFFTTKDLEKGMGLGMSISQKIIIDHGGSIQVSNQDQGLKVLVTLPAMELSSYSQSEVNRFAGNSKILVVDDEVKILNLINSSLSAMGHHFVGCTTLKDAENFLSQIRFKLVVIDCNLPDGKGVDLAKKMRSQNDQTPILLISTGPFLKDALKGISSLPNVFSLEKPFSQKDFTHFCSDIIKGIVHD